MDLCAIWLKLYMFYFLTKIVIPFIVLVESCCGAKICEHNSVMERGPKWVKLNRLTISHSTVWIWLAIENSTFTSQSRRYFILLQNLHKNTKYIWGSSNHTWPHQAPKFNECQAISRTDFDPQSGHAKHLASCHIFSHANCRAMKLLLI